MKSLLIILAITCSVFSFSQGYGIEDNFYPSQVRELDSWYEIKRFWESEIDRISKEIKIRRDNSELLYQLAIARHNANEQNLIELIELLDKAISMNPKKAKYYAVRGIIKYNWGAWSPDYDIGEGCPDIKKSIALGLSGKLKENESIVGILGHPSCK